MKKTLFSLSAVAATALLLTASCNKSDSSSTPAASTGTFTAKVAGDAYTAPDSSYLFNGSGGTIALLSKDAKGRGFQMALFEKDFPVNKAVEVAYTPSISYLDAAGKAYVTKSGTMTVTEYGKTSTGTVNHLVGSFSVVVTRDQKDLEITEGKFDVKTK